jgi:hypothetical protein
MAPDPNDFIQDQIHLHGRLKAARYLTCSEYSIEHEDGFAYLVADPRAETDGPIRAVELTHGRDQMLNVDFEQRMTSQCFSADPDRDVASRAMLPEAVLEMA